MASKNKKFVYDGWAVWIEGEDVSTVYLNDWIDPKGHSYIDIAVKIKSFDISIRPYEDCCTVFVPKHPQIKPNLNVSIEEENKFNYEEMIEEAINNVQVIEIDINKHYSVFEESDIL